MTTDNQRSTVAQILLPAMGGSIRLLTADNRRRTAAEIQPLAISSAIISLTAGCSPHEQMSAPYAVALYDVLNVLEQFSGPL